MGFRFRRSIKILPGIRVNIGKKGVTSVTVGKSGSSFNIGEKGVHANLGIKGTGLSTRTKLVSTTARGVSRPLLNAESLQGNRKMSRASKINQLEKLERMRKRGDINELEYLRLKEELLSEDTPVFNEPVILEAPPKKQGCLGALGKFILVGIAIIVGVSFFTGGKSKSSSNTQEIAASEPIALTAESDEQKAQSLEIEAHLSDARLEFEESDKKITKVWSDMNPTVREHLKKEQIAWNRSKESACKQEGKSSGESVQEQELGRLACLTTWTDKRISELISLEKELAPKVVAAELSQVNNDFEVAKAELLDVSGKVPVEIKQQLAGDIEAWETETGRKCSLEASKQLDNTQSEIAATKCTTKAFKEKTKEFKGYIIP